MQLFDVHTIFFSTRAFSYLFTLRGTTLTQLSSGYAVLSNCFYLLDFFGVLSSLYLIISTAKVHNFEDHPLY